MLLKQKHDQDAVLVQCRLLLLGRVAVVARVADVVLSVVAAIVVSAIAAAVAMHATATAHGTSPPVSVSERLTMRTGLFELSKPLR